MRFAVAYFATLVAFVGVDLVWLGLIAKNFYRREMGELLAVPFNMPAAAAFYLLYPLGVVLFAIQPAFASSSWTTALLLGVALGAFAYGTYDLTSLATIRNWSAKLAVVDMAWGAVLTGVAAAVGYLMARGW
jgi:uncharacterized membrane protein